MHQRVHKHPLVYGTNIKTMWPQKMLFRASHHPYPFAWNLCTPITGHGKCTQAFTSPLGLCVCVDLKHHGPKTRTQGPRQRHFSSMVIWSGAPPLLLSLILYTYFTYLSLSVILISYFSFFLFALSLTVTLFFICCCL